MSGIMQHVVFTVLTKYLRIKPVVLDPVNPNWTSVFVYSGFFFFFTTHPWRFFNCNELLSLWELNSRANHSTEDPF